jgi:hypothetical protein
MPLTIADRLAIGKSNLDGRNGRLDRAGVVRLKLRTKIESFA